MHVNDLNLLVVDDDDFQRRTIMEMLCTLGTGSVRAAENGKQALELILKSHESPIDIVLCDLNMPEMDGLEFLRLLGQSHRDIAVVIISALGSKLLLSAGKMAKMHGLKLLGAVEKPITMEHLEAFLSEYERSENKWQKPVAAQNFALKEIMRGISAKQFEPFFQPKVDMKTGNLVGAEALARWIHPEQGVIDPHAFIPLLEQSGNIDALAFLMLEKTVAACRSFHSLGHRLVISVNLSLVSLDDPALADKITQVLRRIGIDPQYIALEITESAAMTDVAQALENLTRLCMNGFELSIDDYGSGYSSLQQLTRIPFSELKIDQSFVKDLAENEMSRIVVESSVNMARELQIKSIAEGVETQEDWDTLKSMGCDTAQGYFIARPMNLASFIEYCDRYSSHHPV